MLTAGQLIESPLRRNDWEQTKTIHYIRGAESPWNGRTTRLPGHCI